VTDVTMHDEPDLIATTIRRAADVRRLSERDRAKVASWLADTVAPTTIPVRARRRRRRTIFAASSAALVLIPWVVTLSTALPKAYTAHQWRVVWIGFDIVLVAALSATVWTAWRARLIVIGALIVTATLLVCDAWFDITMSWGSNDQVFSLATAVIFELPLALYLAVVASRLLKAVIRHVWALEGGQGDAPAVYRVPVLIAARRNVAT